MITSFEKRLSENLKKEGLNVKLGLRIHSHLWRFIKMNLIEFLIHNKDYTGINIGLSGFINIKSKTGKTRKPDLKYLYNKYNLQHYRYIALLKKYRKKRKKLKI